jgi:rSAM/selenodomain-associated transferase 1
VKTRLCPPLSPEQAADLYRAMLLDVLEQHAHSPPAERVVWYTPAQAVGWFRDHVPEGYRLLPQQGESLGARMAHVFRVHHAEGFRSVVLRGTDSPTLPDERVARAFDLLERVDLVLCPDLDGGYNLVGLNNPCDALFELEMSHATVFDQTMACARRFDLAVEVLPAHHDVDTASDLKRLLPELTRSRTPRTFRWLRTAR